LPSATESIGLTGLRILVVDDQDTDRLLLTKMLGDCGAAAEGVENGPQALRTLKEAASTRPFDAAILDCRMPDMDGGNVAMAVQGDPEISSTKLVLLSSPDQVRWAQAAEPAGISAYLSKPVQLDQLLNCINRQEPFVLEATTEQQEEHFEADVIPLEPILIQKIRDLERDVGRRSFRELVELYLNSAPGRVRKIHEGIVKEDSSAAGDAAHALQGTSSYLSAVRLVALCAEIEHMIQARMWESATRLMPTLQAEYERVARFLLARTDPAVSWDK